MSPVWTVALEGLEDVRGTLIFYGFIVEEAIQAAGFACWILRSAKRYDEAAEKAAWTLEFLILPAIDFFHRYGVVTYPMNQSYIAFYEASKRLMETYVSLKETE